MIESVLIAGLTVVGTAGILFAAFDRWLGSQKEIAQLRLEETKLRVRDIDAEWHKLQALEGRVKALEYRGGPR